VIGADLDSRQPAPCEGTIPAGSDALWWREVGEGQPVIVLHGGPDFDCGYLLPELDQLADGYRLIYFDQRGRGRSAAGVQPQDVSLASDIADIDSVRRHFGLESVALLGHSWGGLLAMEYAVRHPERVSHLILLNTAFARGEDRFLFQEERRRKSPDTPALLQALASIPAFQDGDPAAVAAYYRVHFSATVRQPKLLDAVVERVTGRATRESILRARAIEERLLEDTWLSDGYDLLPALAELPVPTLVIHGDEDFIPIPCASRIADAIRGARFVLIPDCGHFSYLERPEAVRTAINAFFHRAGEPPSE
jgi:proline iminopeptidase